MPKYEYDVCLSFAGEDREYVQKVARLLKQENVSVFYDTYEQDSLWGKDLYQHLSSIYKDKCNYVIIFISKFYAEKLWTKHELKNAQARAFAENEEYILPVIFDETEIPGIPKTTGYIDARQKTPYQIVKLFLTKLHKTSTIPNFPEHPYYIHFQNLEKFDVWHSEVCRKQGYPRSGRTMGKVRHDACGTVRYCEPITHRKAEDTRIAAIIKEDRLPADMIDQLAEREYEFTRISMSDFEEIGFNDPMEDYEVIIPDIPFLMKRKQS